MLGRQCEEKAQPESPGTFRNLKKERMMPIEIVSCAEQKREEER
jgi:hypothetical protein